jgi:hypothetical protein
MAGTIVRTAGFQYEVIDGEFVNSTFYDNGGGSGELRLENCQFSAGNNGAAVGINARDAGSFFVNGCTFHGFATAITSLVMRNDDLAVCNSTFDDCKLPVGAMFTTMWFHGATFAGYTEAAIAWRDDRTAAGLVDISVKFCLFTPTASFTGPAIQLVCNQYSQSGRNFESSCFNGATLPQIELNGGGCQKWSFSDLSFAAPQPDGGSAVWVDPTMDQRYRPSLPEFAYGVTGCSISSEGAECPDEFGAGIPTEAPEATIPTPIRPMPNEPSPVVIPPASTPEESPAQTEPPPSASLTPEMTPWPATATQEFSDANTRPRRGYMIYRMVAFAFALD